MLQKWYAPKNKSQLTTIWHRHQPSWHDLWSQRSRFFTGNSTYFSECVKLLAVCMSLCLHLASSVPIKAFLSHEDLLPIEGFYSTNPFVLKEKIYQDEVRFTEVTICLRLKFLSFKEKREWTQIMTFVPGIKSSDGRWVGAGGINMRDPSEGSAWGWQTFLGSMTEIIEQGGTTSFWPIFKEPVNAGDWNHFCWRVWHLSSYHVRTPCVLTLRSPIRSLTSDTSCVYSVRCI